MEENSKNDGVLAPITPAKLGYNGFHGAAAGEVVQESLNSADNVKLGSGDSDGNLFSHGDFGGGLGTKSVFADEDSQKSSRIDDSSVEVGESGKISCMQLLFSQIERGKHIRTVETSANLSAEETASIHKHAEVNETDASNVFGTGGLDSVPGLEKQHGRKRKRTCIDLNKNPRQRMKVKKHRPKIFDASKPKKIPKERENVRKSRKTPKTTPESNPPAPNPLTPEPLTPNPVICEETSSEDGKLTNNNGQTVNQNSEQPTKSCKRVLNFDTEDQVKEGNVENVESDVALVSPMSNVGSARCQNCGAKSIFNCLLLSLNSEPQDFGSSTGMRKIIKEYERLSLPIHQLDVKPLEILDFPKAFKQRRTRRQRRTMYSKFWEADKLCNGHKAVKKERVGARSGMKRNLVFRIDIPISFPPTVKRKRSKTYTRQNLACKSNQTLSTSFPNLPITESPTSFPTSKTYTRQNLLSKSNQTLSTSFPNLPIAESASANSLGAETRPSLDKDSFQGGSLDNLCVENQSSVTNEAELFPVVVLPSHDQILKCNLGCDDDLLKLKLDPQYEDVTHSHGPLEQKNVPSNIENILDIEDIGKSSTDPCIKDLVDLIQKLESLHIRDESGQLVVRDQNATGALIPHKGRFDPRKGDKPKQRTPKVDLDQETMRVWNMLMENDGGEDMTEKNEEKEKWWAEEREMFRKRVNSFIALMHLIQGNRRFSQWKGSVVDSVVGVFLTQNVSDHLSSSAFMSLASRFPPTSESNEDKDTPLSQESIGSNIEAAELTNDVDSKQPYPSQTELHKNQELEGKGEENIVSITEDLDGRLSTCGVQEFLSCQRDSNKATSSSQRTGEYAASRVQEGITCGCSTSSSNCQVSLGCSLKEKVVTEDSVSSNKKHQGGRKGKKPKKNDNDPIKRKGKVEEKKENPIDWDELRKTYSSGRNNLSSTMDSVDWEKVRLATVEEISSIIAQRGMHNVIGKRIKNFLDRMVKDHGSIDLEWLRDVPPDKAKEYLLSIEGLGLKSVECVRLLTLHHHAFPVDTNVGRIAVRLGWVPLQPLPEDLEIDLLNNYPLVDSIQKYLWPRLCKLPQHVLYELHYQMITFGKVFCTKRQPNCNACPLKAECRHFASAFARAKLRLPGPQEKNIVRTNAPNVVDDDASRHATQATVPLLKGSCSKSIYGTQRCDPIIEVPASPEPQCRETLERDIEDLCDDSDGEIPTIRLNTEEYRETLLNCIEDENLLLPEGDMSKALVALTPEAASIPAPKLRTVERLFTVHYVYELPDSHPLLVEFEKLEADDPCPYLFAVWSSADAIEKQNDERVSGTILIPCKTANRGSFPLNGTYYQVNEVFIDDKSSECPISVPREWLWNLPRRLVYCATSATSIFKEMELLEIQYCFWKGFVCVRGFDKKTRAPMPIRRRFHPHGDKKVEGSRRQKKYKKGSNVAPHTIQ